ncbi:glyoxal oxidase N-terminus-domain-containing protein [Cladochytrium replicatum]|nr:glyoxal oxidase N-terminus-domain-containing protein [Cladochytrium replicatum]
MASVAVSLAVLLSVDSALSLVHESAIEINHGSLLDKRALTPSLYSSVGCYTEGNGGRALTLSSFFNTNSMTVTSCIAFCSNSNYVLAGLEYAQECYCGNNLKNNATVAPAGDCNMACNGNLAQTCGSSKRLSIWSYNGATPVPAPIPSVNKTKVFAGGFTYKGCFQDNVPNYGKTLAGAKVADDTMTQDSCISFCDGKGYSFAGVEYGRECSCGNSFATTVAAPESDCSMQCLGSEAQLCGAGNRLNIFGKQSITTTTATSTTTTTTTTTRTSAAAVTTSSSSFGPNFQYVGCYAEGTTGRALNRDATTSNALTPAVCISYCSGKGYSLAGLEFGVECFCGNDIRNQGSAAPATNCSMSCSGDATQTCGNGGRLSVWSLNGATPVIVPPPTVKTNNLPGSWSYSGCYVDPAAPRALGGEITAGTMTPVKCINLCNGKGYKFAGIEYGNECYCGYTLTTAKVAETDCNTFCTSDESYFCGAGNRLTVYVNGAFGVTTTTTTTTATAVPPPIVQTTGLPNGWVILDCYTDYPGTKVLTGGSTTSATMTPGYCINYCAGLGLTLAGLENGNTCLCDTAIRNNHVRATGCTTSCAGAAGTVCGGTMKVLIYNYTLSAPPTATSPIPSPSPSPILGIKKSGFVKAGVQFLGCYQENGNRALPAFVKDNVPITVDSCIDICQTAGYRLAGMEFSKECWCDNAIASVATLTTWQADSQCNMPCTGDQYQVCGDASRITIYNNTQFTPTAPPGGGGAGGGGGALTQVSPKFTISGGKNYSWVGCYTEGQGVYGRALQGSQSILNNQTVYSCGTYCVAQNFTLFGVEYGVECYCGNILINGPAPVPSLDGCMMPCGGNASQTCGGGQKLQIYSLNGQAPAVRPVPVVLTKDLPDKWYYAGCWHDTVNGPNKAVPFKSVFNGNMTVLNCIDHCQLFGYAVAAAQYGDECWCGDRISPDAAQVAEIQCTTPCSGNTLELCGAGAISNIYVHNGSLFEWQTPTVTGRYEQFMGGVDVPLLAGVAPYNNKVVFLARLAGGQPNTTHAYEFDWKNRNYRTAFREMHIKTDIFCAAGNILPDSIGRFLAVAGWADEALQGVRVYKPTGQHFVNGTTDWEENPPALHLKVARWYPTTATLTNGSIIVVGGSAAANTPNQPSVEILPNPANSGPTPLELPLLVQTDGHNLYCGVYVLPNTGALFIFAGERAQLLRQTDFSIQRELPICPNGVLREGYRTYPFTGSYALLPMTAPAYRPEFLVCGGGIGGGGKAHNTCARIGPEDTNPTWIVERMPFDRVMPNMVQLPDGTYLIVNGAAEGVAGFGLAKKPVLTAILYDPAAVVHKRISILNTTVVARMYHSEATLLPDGTVLISGSDPADNDFPEEYRLEIYVPPYIANNPPRPTFTLANGASRDLAYGQGLALTVVARTTNKPIRVSFMRDGVNTHSTHMDQRFIWLDITIGPTSQTGSGTYTVRMPPNGKVAPPGWYQIWVLEGPTPCQEHTWVRIGGDPSSLYGWPSVPGYNLTGLGQTVTW